MTGERWKKVTKADPCPVCGKPDWCAWTPDGELLKCERQAQAPPGMALVKAQDGGGLFRYEDGRPFAPAPRQTANAKLANSQKRGRIVTAYDYRNAEGELLFQVVRCEPKAFPQRRPDGNGGWIWGLDGVPRVLYQLPELLAADPQAWVFVPEGEKDVDNIRGIGLVATTNPGGKGKWRHLADDSALHGRRVAVIPDRDRDGGGMKHAQDIAQHLHDKADEVRIVEVPRQFKDASDWLDSLDGKEPAELAAVMTDLAEAAPVWTAREDACGPVIVRLSKVESQPLRWLWPGRIPLAKLMILSGDPALGKSTLTLDVAARVSRGDAWPDDAGEPDEPGGVVLLSAEDDVADTIKPRLDAAGGDAERIVVLTGMRDVGPDAGLRERVFSLRHDLPGLEKAVDSCRNPRLVIVDPVTAYLDGADSHKNADIRGLLAPLVELAARKDVAILVVSHLNKSAGGSAMYRTIGSVGFVATVRAGWLVVNDKEEPLRRLFLPLKTNLAAEMTGLAYRIEPSQHNPDIGVISWERGTVTVSADEALAVTHGDGSDSSELGSATEWLRTELVNGPMLVNEINVDAKANGIAPRTLRRAKDALGIKPRKDGSGGRWSWALPPEGGQGDHV
ncbi:MAG: AAA family ATPase [Planctomycetota bacterium]|jgi:hypothetical protein